jgi:uncharacterized coiled-coil protein SlyX
MEEIKFDESSGFSQEEQQEIIDQINALSVEKEIIPEKSELKTEAKKKGVLFPLLVNLAAVAVLAGGFFALSFLHGKDDATIREGTASLGVTERALIQEIRAESSRQISAKDKEIDAILAKLAEADSESKQLQSSVADLTEGQKARATQLSQMQDEYRSTLAGLQSERSKMLEDSRSREAEIRAQAEEKTTSLSSQIAQSQQSLTAAMDELRKLSSDQDKAQAAQAQLGAFYGVVDDDIKNARYDDALSTLASMKEYLSAPVFTQVKALTSSRNTHLAAAASLEEAVNEAKKRSGAAPVEAAPAEKPAEDDAAAEAIKAQLTSLEQKVADQEKTIASLSAGGSEQQKALEDFQNTIAQLREANENQQNELNQKDSTIQTLTKTGTEKDGQIADLQDQKTNLETQNKAKLEFINSLPDKFQTTAIPQLEQEIQDFVSKNNQ